MRGVLFLIPLLVVPIAIAAEPQGGPPEPWILQGSAMVDGCDAPSTATIYTWVQAWSANFQLTLAGGCEPVATVFYGTGSIWDGFALDAFLGQVPTEGTLGSFFDGPTVPLDLSQTLPDGRPLHVTGDLVIVF